MANEIHSYLSAVPNPLPLLRTLLRRSLDGFCAVAFPAACPLCGEELSFTRGIGICNACWLSLNPWRGAICDSCGIPLASEIVGEIYLCGACRRNEHYFDRARSYGLYSGHLREAALQLKFHGRERWGGKLGALLIHPWRQLAGSVKESAPLLAPVPLHPSRQRERGFNQADLLACGLLLELRKLKSAALPHFEPRCLRRVKATAPQSGLHHRARLENVRHGFSASAERVRGRDIILVDDVMTTGATVSACARTLKQAGAAQVIVLTLARATPQFPDGAMPPGEPAHRVDGMSPAQT